MVPPLTLEAYAHSLITAQNARIAKGEGVVKVGSCIPHVPVWGWVTGKRGKEELKQFSLQTSLLQDDSRIEDLTLLITIKKLGTPECKRRLEVIAGSIDHLAANGISRIFVVTPDSPELIQEQASKIDPSRRIQWISDASLNLGMMNLLCDGTKTGHGICLQRSMFLLNNRTIVQKMYIEQKADSFHKLDAMAAVAMVKELQEDNRKKQARSTVSTCASRT